MNKLGNYVLLLTSIFVAVLIAEFLLRMYVPEIGWTQRKESIIGWANDEYNQFEPSGKNKRVEKRILFLGDSFLAGSGVSNLEKRFPILLESLLNHRVSSRIIATGGWGTDQQLLAFKQKGKFWEPDLVVVAFCANNDISNILSHHHGPNKLKPYFVVENNRLEPFDGYGISLNNKTNFEVDSQKEISDRQSVRIYLVDFIRHILKTRNPANQINYNGHFQAVDVRYRNFLNGEEKPKEIYQGQDKLSWSPQNGVNHVSAYIKENFEKNAYQWELFELILMELKKEVESSGGKLAIMLLPVIFNPEDIRTIAGGIFVNSFQTPDGDFTFRSVEPRQRLSAISERVGITFLDPTQEFIKYVSDKDLMKAVWPNPNDRHFSELGHEILANLLKDDIKVIVNKDKGNAEQGTAPDRYSAALHSGR